MLAVTNRTAPKGRLVVWLLQVKQADQLFLEAGQKQRGALKLLDKPLARLA